MEFETAVNIAEFLGGVGVICSLIFVAYQMRENNMNTRDVNYHQVMSHNITMGRMIGADQQLASLYRRGCDDMAQLNIDERWQFGSLMMAMFCDFNEQYTLYHRGRLDEEFWRAIEHNMKFYLSRPGVQHWWRTHPFKLDEAFTAYLNEYLKQTGTNEPNSK